MLFSEEFAAGRINAREAAEQVREREQLRTIRERREVVAAEAAAVARRTAVTAVDVSSPVRSLDEAPRELAAACP